MRKENGFWPDSAEKPRKYSADDFIGYFKDFFTNGVLGKDVTKLKVYSNNNMSVKITAGTAYLDGRWFSPKSPVSITLKASDVAYSRIDLICIRCDYAQKNIYFHVVTGVPQQNPEIPEITRDEFYFDLGIAAVTVPVNATIITQAEIKDLRFDSKYCGQVTSTIKSIDTTDLFAQYEAQWELLKAACAQDEEAVIKAWDALNTVKRVNGTDPVDGNVSLNLDDIPDSEVFYKQNYSVQKGYTTAESVKFITPFAEVPTVIVSGASEGGTSAYASALNATENGFTISKNRFTGVNWAAFGRPGNTAMVRSFKMYGKSTQDGIPTSEAPVDIVSVGDDGSTTVVACGKNLYEGSQDWSGEWESSNKWTTSDEIYNGLTVKSTSGAWSGLYKRLYAEAGKTYTFTCYAKSASGTAIVTIYAVFPTGTEGQIEGSAMPSKVAAQAVTLGTEWTRLSVKYTCTASGYINPRVEKRNAEDTLYICGYQLEESPEMTDYEPYKTTTAEITTGLPLCGIPVENGGNYTDSNGQQWICDELIYNADGTGKVVKYTAKLDSYNGEEITTDYISSTGSLESGAAVIYQLKTKQETELSDAEMNQLWDLYTYRNAPFVTNDEGAPMEEVTIYA